MDNLNCKCKHKKDNSKSKEIKFINMKRKNSECQTILSYNDFNDCKINKNYLSNNEYILTFYKVNNIINNKINGKENEKKNRLLKQTKTQNKKSYFKINKKERKLKNISLNSNSSY